MIIIDEEFFNGFKNFVSKNNNNIVLLLYYYYCDNKSENLCENIDYLLECFYEDKNVKIENFTVDVNCL